MELGEMRDADELLIFEGYDGSAGITDGSVQRVRIGPEHCESFLRLAVVMALHAAGGAVYIRLTDHKVTGTRAIGDTVLVDYDEQGEAIGIEVLGLMSALPSTGDAAAKLEVTHVRRDRHEASGSLPGVDVTFSDYEASLLGSYSHCLIRHQGCIAAGAYGLTRHEAYVNALNDLARKGGFPA